MHTSTTKPLATPDRLAEATPVVMTIEARIAMAARCRDADSILKVSGAGTLHVEADGTRTQLMHNGLKVIADGYYGERMTRLIGLCGGHHEPQEERIFHEVLRHLPPDATMLELGGFWSYYSLWFLSDAPGPGPLLSSLTPRTLLSARKTRTSTICP